MITFKLPVLEQSIINNVIVNKELEVECELDMSLNSQVKWETQFSAQAEKETLFDFAERIKNNDSPVIIISKLKVIYCWLNSSKFNNFTDFLKIFDYTDLAYFKKLIKAISRIFDTVLSSNLQKN